jgi:hypothetical protein
MQMLPKWIIGLQLFIALPLLAEVELVRDSGMQFVFSGPARQIQVQFENKSSSNSAVNVGARQYQATSATAVPTGGLKPWKKIEVLAGQKVMEARAFDFPEVKAATRFVIRWIAETNRVLGNSEVMAFPTNLLAGLRPYAQGEPIGVFDPDDRVSTLLKNLTLEIEDLTQSEPETFSGKFAIVWGGSKASDLRTKVESLAKKSKIVVWVIPTPKSALLNHEPAMYSVRREGSTIIILQSRLVTDLQSNPQAQLNLLRGAQLAAKPELLDLPGNNP